jgi:hypothetical protein
MSVRQATNKLTLSYEQSNDNEQQRYDNRQQV